MAIPVELEGKQYFVSFPTLADFRTFRDYLRREHRREVLGALPDDMPDKQLRQVMAAVDAECERIDGFDFSALLGLSSKAGNIEGASLLFHSLLRHENSHVTLDWVRGLMERAEQDKPQAVQALRNLREATMEVISAKKNEVEAARAENQSTSTTSTSTSQSSTDSPPQKLTESPSISSGDMQPAPTS